MSYFIFRSSQGKPKPNRALFHIVPSLGPKIGGHDHSTLCGRDVTRGAWTNDGRADLRDAMASDDFCKSCAARLLD